MKRFFSLIVCLIMLIPSALAETVPGKIEESDPLYTSLRERAMEMAGLFDEALRNEEFVSLQLPDSLLEELAPIRAQDYTNPLDVIILRADDALASYLPVDPRALLESVDLSPALKTLVMQRLYNSIGTILTAQNGPTYIALSSAFRLTDSFIQPEGMDGPCYAVIQYGGAYAFLVSFVPTANGTVIANAQFIPSQAMEQLIPPQA